MEPLVALRNAIGVAAPIAVGVALGSPVPGVAAGLAALQVSYSDNAGPYRQRAKRMLAATVLGAFAVLAGGLAIRHPALAGALILVSGFIAGLVVCLGDTAENLGVLTLVTLIIYAAQPLTGREALLSSLLAVVGGLLQTCLALLFWPIHRYRPERRELSALYRELSQAAITPAISGRPPAIEAITSARTALAALSGDTSIQADRLWSLFNQAERIRLTLLTLRRLRKRLQREPSAQQGFQVVEEYLSLAAKVLDAVADSVSHRIAASSGCELLPRLQALADQLRQEQAEEREPPLAALEKDLRYQMDALTGQLRAAVRTTTESTPAALQEFAVRDARRPWQARFFSRFATLRANLTLQSSAFRHAIRLTLCLAVGEAAAHLLHHPRSYWLAMTIVLVLKQEFAATFNRGILRIFGTILGLIFATALFHILPSGVGLEVFLLASMVFLLRWAGAGNYGVFTIAMSALVVLMLAIAGVPPVKVVFARGEMTLLGGVIALITYLVWPTWERSQAPQTLAQLVEAYRHYFDVLATARVENRSPDERELGAARVAARLARSNMEASFERLRAEPGMNAEEVPLLSGILANCHRFARAIMTLEVVSVESAPARQEFRTFALDVDNTLDALVQALRGGASVLENLPDLREDHHRLLNSASTDISRYGLVNQETDRMVNALDTLAEQVRDWLGKQDVKSKFKM